ncbi:efflux RND transporter periplasmic adaptor subunit [Bdellovibrio bacteriovorus]|uniref:efflux RND transporter periplasmic adaptor subunit n=1 Tax=Bdellovibrio bacteriovorus TaxID=959 RepID=UPI0021CF698B|nr:efflux RND transporter periplasmic adaptor subunit [Bdellovibrio bacteriovorus]UXR63647.1 efflux RND transporter periplasmic adaptor subunit [Bdellovibrio bacteriovorus]
MLAYLAKVFLFKSSFSYAGTVEVTKVDIPARVASVIEAFPVKEGQTVQKDQLLVSLTCEEIKLGYDLAKRNFDRAAQLYRSGSIAQDSFDQIKNKKDDIETRKGWCSVMAPLQGTVLTTYFEPGEMVLPGAKLLTIGDLEEIYAYFYLPHDEIAALRMEQKIEAILPEMDDKKFAGTVSYINPEAEFTPKNVQTRDERTRLVYAVKVRFKNPDGILKPGMTLEWQKD